MKTNYCAYPPQIAADVEITGEPDGERTVFIVGSVCVGRYLLLRATERQVLGLIDGARQVGGICEEFTRQTSATLPAQTLIRFLAKLDSYGILAGERVSGAAVPELPISQMHYIRFKLFNPERLFERLLPMLRWIWTTGFFVFSLGGIVVALMVALLNSAEVRAYGEATLRDHFLAIFVAAWLVGVTHEFAHGMTCKAFGGRATEVGVLMVYYFLPALYCNVSGIHLIPNRGRRLWVIAAGVYWQLMAGAFSLLVWYLLAPHTLLADAAFVVLLGSVLDVFFNANPLIKLDGYYFLSQSLRLPNLMDRSRAYWRMMLTRILFGGVGREAASYGRRERVIYLIFGLLSFVYNAAFVSLIVLSIGGWLMDSFYLLGLLLALGVALIFARRPVKQMAEKLRFVAGFIGKHISGPRQTVICRTASEEDKMTDRNQNTNENKTATPPFWHRRLILLSLLLLVVVALAMPWRASVGNYGTLMAVPDQETIIRAPESASLMMLRVHPGDQVAGGAVVGQMGNFDLEEQIVAVQSDLARANADHDRLLGELHEREEAVARAGMQLRQRQQDYDEIESERRQIAGRRRIESSVEVRRAGVISASTSLTGQPFDQTVVNYPAALAALQAEADSASAQFDEASAQRDRLRILKVEGIVPRSELGAAEMRAATCESSFAAARQRLEAALIEHRRKHASTATEVNLANSDLSAERLQITKLGSELNATRELISTLEARRDLLIRKRAQFELTTPRGGAIFGEELPRMVGQYFQKGAEICRVADTRQLLLRVSVPEREIGDVRTGAFVRLITRAYPNRVFRGAVSRIAGESESSTQAQTTYRVELTIENGEGWLRPGMTAFARIDFDRQMVARILLHKIRQTLRPELWML